MEQLITTSYLFEKDPLLFTFLRESDPILSVTTNYHFGNMQPRRNGIQLEFDGGTLELTQQRRQFRFRWQGEAIQARIPLAGRWFGLGELVNQPWDLTQVSLPLSDFLTADAGATGFSNLMSPAFLTDQGVLLIVHSPVKLGINQPPDAPTEFPDYVFGEQIPFDRRPVFDTRGRGDGHLTLLGDDLPFDLYILNDALAAHRRLVTELGHPAHTPPLELFGAPVWTTWAQYKDQIDQDAVLDFARQIRKNQFPYHLLEIDDRWQTAYGDLEFDPVRFPDAPAMIEQLHEWDFKVTAWVIPFLQPRSQAGIEGAEQGFLVRHPDGGPYLVRWWQGRGYLLDVTNPAALAWFGRRLRTLQDATGLDGFKFDGGEAMYVPKDAVLHKPGDSRNHYSHCYVDWVGRNFPLSEVRTGWQNQTAPILFRLWDLWSTWGADNGLAAILPATLNLSLTGYPFTFPDMIGGNGYFTFPRNPVLNALIQKVIIPAMERRKQAAAGDEDVGVHASDVPEFIAHNPFFGWPPPELMVRWTQLNALLPVMQFSITPWQFGEQTAAICRRYTRLHLEYTPLLEDLARQAARTGEPIIRPVFFLAPTDPDALACGDQFLVGDQLLVAPVTKKGASKRDIYLPHGTWRDHWSSKRYTGPQTLKDHPAPLEVLPFFHREE
jgi:hypothetical protein